MKYDTIVLGAGMVGVSTALQLQRRGQSVALVDRRPAAEETSYGNAGILQSEGVVPYAFPREIKRIVRAALNMTSEAHVHWRALPAIAGPVMAYWRNSTPERLARSAIAFAPLAARCIAEHEALMVEAGTSALDRVSGLAARRGFIALMFALSALSLAGLPPFSGFVAKLALIQEGVAQGRGVIVAVSLAVSLLTLFSMTKIWAAAFWGEPKVSTGSAGRGMLAATASVVVLSLAVAVFAQPIAELSGRAAADLVDPSGYVSAVLGGA